MNLSRADYERILSRQQGTAAPVKTRKPVGAGDVSVRKAWLAEMCRLPGIFIAIHTTTPGNNGIGHWAAKARTTKRHREAVGLALAAARNTLPPFPVRVKFTRYGGKADAHNLPGMLKAVIDQVAQFYMVDDGDPRWNFQFNQVKSRHHGVRIEIESL
jgi:hypothetical protein